VLEVLDLSFNDIVYQEETFQNLREAIRNSSLRELNLTGNQFGAGGWRHVASALNQVSKLQTLILQKCGIKVGNFYILISALGKN
jgi:Leucine Rich repeat